MGSVDVAVSNALSDAMEELDHLSKSAGPHIESRSEILPAEPGDGTSVVRMRVTLSPLTMWGRLVLERMRERLAEARDEAAEE